MKSLLKVVGASYLLFAMASLAQAQTTTFANFTQDVAADKSFQFNNTSGFFTQNTGTLATTIQVNFTFLVQPTSGLITQGTPLTANLTITSSLNGGATIGVANATQRLNNVQMSFIGTGALAGQNLLTVFASTGTLSGSFGTNTASLAETDNGGLQVINYTSDFLNFSNSTQRNYSLPLNNLNPAFTNGGGFISNFSSNATGQFASNGIVPEPTTMTFVGLGIAGLALARRRRTQG